MLQRAIDADAAPPLAGLISYGVAGWALFWVGLIAAFPYSRQVRAVYLFNDKLRGMLSLWFVPLLLTIVPGARRHLLRPFRADLLRDARTDDFNERNWFPDSQVLDRGGARLRLADALSRIAGVCLLVGESGLGKTLFLQRVAKRSRRPLAFLYARACIDGVLEAIAQATEGVQDPRFFESMIYTGSLDLIIDGLNEVSAEARGKILEFVKRNARDGNIVVSTQPLEWGDKDGPPVPGARILELLPLDRTAMDSFLLSRPVGAEPKRKVHGPEYRAAVEEFLRTTLDEAPSEEERAAAQLVLSNPMDLTYASELIAAGLMPRPNLTSPIRPAVPRFSLAKSLSGKGRCGPEHQKSAVVPTKSILTAANVPIIGGHHVLALQSSPEGWQATPLLERCREHAGRRRARGAAARAVSG